MVAGVACSWLNTIIQQHACTLNSRKLDVQVGGMSDCNVTINTLTVTQGVRSHSNRKLPIVHVHRPPPFFLRVWGQASSGLPFFKMAAQVVVPDDLKRYLGPGHGLTRLKNVTWVNATTLVAVSPFVIRLSPCADGFRQLSNNQLCTVQDGALDRQTLPDGCILTAASRLWTCPDSTRCVVQLQQVSQPLDLVAPTLGPDTWLLPACQELVTTTLEATAVPSSSRLALPSGVTEVEVAFTDDGWIAAAFHKPEDTSGQLVA